MKTDTLTLRERFRATFRATLKTSTGVSEFLADSNTAYISWLETELAAVTEQRDKAREVAARWESSSDAMERAGAEQARRADENREWALKAIRERDEAREQRDRLAEALKDALHDLETSDGLMWCDPEEGNSLFYLEQRSIPKARKALQSLNQPTP